MKWAGFSRPLHLEGRLWTPRPQSSPMWSRWDVPVCRMPYRSRWKREFSGYAAGIRRNRLLLERERARWCTGVLGAHCRGYGHGMYARLSGISTRTFQPSAGVRFAVTPICSTAFRLPTPSSSCTRTCKLSPPWRQGRPSISA